MFETRSRWSSLCGLALCLGASAAQAETITIAPGPEAQETLLEALILAQPGDEVVLTEGRYAFTRGLSCAVDSVTIRGAGMDATVLDFSQQTDGAQGVLLTGDDQRLADLTLEGAPGDALKAQGCRDLTLERVRADWPGEPSADNGAYGLYPVDCERVRIDACHARGASDAGIYVGQSREVLVTDCRADFNVAGIEIENCRRVEVRGCTATHNTAGILVFDLPNLPAQGGGEVLVVDNDVHQNDTPNFAPQGNIVATVPMGVGVLVMGNRAVEIRANRIGDHATTNVLILSYLTTGRPLDDPDYQPFPLEVHVHHNAFGPCGDAPDGPLGLLILTLHGLPAPDVVWDGIDAPLPARPLSLHDNTTDSGDAPRFADLDLGTAQTNPAQAAPSTDPSPHRAPLPAIPPVTWSDEE